MIGAAKSNSIAAVGAVKVSAEILATRATSRTRASVS
jgi:hypothetical protein